MYRRISDEKRHKTQNMYTKAFLLSVFSEVGNCCRYFW